MSDIEIVRKVVSRGREFYVVGIRGMFGVPDSLKACNDAGYQALFMPELGEARANVNKDSRLWQAWFLTPSVRVTGRSRQGNPVVVYAHIPTSLSDPVNIRRLIDERILVDGAGPMDQDEFYDLLGREGEGRVFVVDYGNLRKSPSGVVEVDDALYHPQTIPFLGGRAIAEAYLAKHKDVHGNRIGIWHSGDGLADRWDGDDLKDRPMGRVLGVGHNSHYGLFSNDNYILHCNVCVVGVVPEAQRAQDLEGRIIQ